jgi:hypothetical protein
VQEEARQAIIVFEEFEWLYKELTMYEQDPDHGGLKPPTYIGLEPFRAEVRQQIYQGMADEADLLDRYSRAPAREGGPVSTGEQGIEAP